MQSGVEGSAAHVILGGSEIISSLEAHSSGRLFTVRVRESRVRGGAASLGQVWRAVAVCGGLQECSLTARVAVRGVGGLTCRWPRDRGKRISTFFNLPIISYSKICGLRPL